MAIEVKIPQISEGVDSAEVVEILVSKGDTIKEEQSIIAIETDKASVEVPSSHSGTVKEIKVKEGEEVKVGDVVLILEEDKKEKGSDEDEGKTEDENEAESKEEKKGKTGDKDVKDKDEKEEASEVERSKDEKSDGKNQKSEKNREREEEEADEQEKPNDQPPKQVSENGGREVAASPGVRRFAREMGVDVKQIEGSGPGGRVSEEDVKAKAKEKGDEEKSPKAELPDFQKYGPVERESLSGIRKATAKNTLLSWQSIPHVFQFDEADISVIEEYRRDNKDKIEEAGGKLTITAILVKVMANALLQFPRFNASIDMAKEEVILKKYYHIGIAVDTEKGLLVPVIRDVNKKTLKELAVEIGELSEKARKGELSPEDMEGGNISISNLGGIGGTQFTPIVFSPQVAILGVSRAKTQAVYTEDGSFEPRPILPLSLSYDHRLIDGADGARFLRWICLALENPLMALLRA